MIVIIIINNNNNNKGKLNVGLSVFKQGAFVCISLVFKVSHEHFFEAYHITMFEL